MLLFCIQKKVSIVYTIKEAGIKYKKAMMFTERHLLASMLFEPDLLTWDFHRLQIVSVASRPLLV